MSSLEGASVWKIAWDFGLNEITSHKFLFAVSDIILQYINNDESNTFGVSPKILIS